eukprot:g5638.t1
MRAAKAAKAGRQCISCSTESNVSLSSTLLFVASEHKKWVNTVSFESKFFHGNSRSIFLVSGSSDGTLLFTQIPYASLLHGNEKHEPLQWESLDKDVEGLNRSSIREYLGTSFSRDGKTLLSASSDHKVSVWKVVENSFEKCGELKDHSQSVWCAKFSDCQNFIATGSSDGTIRLWRVPSFKCLHIFQAGRKGVYSLCWSYHKLDDLVLPCVIGASGDGCLRIWDWDNNHHRANSHRVILRTDPATTLKGHRGQCRTVCSLSMYENTVFVASGGIDHSIKVWSQGSGQWKELFTLLGHAGPVYEIQKISSNENSENGSLPFLISCSEDKTIRIWDVNIQCCLHVLETTHTENITSVAVVSLDVATAINPNIPSLLCATASDDTTVHLYLLRKKKEGKAPPVVVGEDQTDENKFPLPPLSGIEKRTGRRVEKEKEKTGKTPSKSKDEEEKEKRARKFYEACSDEQLRRMCNASMLSEAGTREQLLERLMVQ